MRRACKRTPRDEGGRPVASDIDELVERLAQCDATGEVILFGSGARHELGPRSDLDISIITTRPVEPETTRELQRALPANRAIDLIVDSTADAERLVLHDSLTQAICDEGITLYRQSRQRPWTASGTAPGPNPGRHRQTADTDLWDEVFGQQEVAEASWAAANGYHRRKTAAYTNHRIGFLSRRATAHALRAALRKAKVPAPVKTDVKTLASITAAQTQIQLAGVGPEQLAAIDRMHKWRFVGEADPTANEALETLETAARVLTACGIRLRRPPG